MSELFEIQHLVKLLNPQQNESDPEDSDNNPKLQQNGISDKTIKSPYDKIETVIREDITNDDDSTKIESTTNWKRTPKFVISYRQKVTASDVFLQMSAKTPSTSSCENMVITVDLPGEKMQNIDVKTFNDRIILDSPRFYLNLPLPHPVNPQQGNANWDPINEQLIITLVMEREFDFVNF